MADKKYQVFISSTFKDLKDHRLDISKSVLDLGHIPAAMEYFPAMDDDQLRYIKRVIDQCDYYVLVIAGKYGSMDKDGVSYTEREYEYAVEKGKFVLGFPFHDIKNLHRGDTEIEATTLAKLEAFRARVMGGRLVRMWEDRRDLDLKVTKALSAAFSEFPQDGWVRTPKNSNENLLEEINSLRKENKALSEEILKFSTTPVSLVENLALFTDTYKFKVNIESGTTGKSVFTLDLTWDQIFIAFALFMSVDIDKTSLRQEVARRFASIAVKNGKELSPLFNASIDTIEFERLAIQLTAYGLIQNDRYIYSLTTAGRSKYIEGMTIRIGG